MGKARAGVNAGWYSDPEFKAMFRWWDGESWTSRTLHYREWRRMRWRRLLRYVGVRLP